MLYSYRTFHWEVKKMFDQRKENMYNIWLSYLMASFLTQNIFDALKNDRREFWDFLDHKTLETLKTSKFRWNKKSLVTAIQDFLDVRAGRTTGELQGTKDVNKDPYIFEMLKLLDIEVTHNQKRNSRKKLVKLINQKIKQQKSLSRAETE